MTDQRRTGQLFGEPRVADVSIQAKIVELEREIQFRKRLYPRWVSKGRLDQRRAEQQILVMEAILADYYELNRGARRASGQ